MCVCHDFLAAGSSQLRHVQAEKPKTDKDRKRKLDTNLSKIEKVGESCRLQTVRMIELGVGKTRRRR
jgi:hypothetical protein